MRRTVLPLGIMKQRPSRNICSAPLFKESAGRKGLVAVFLFLVVSQGAYLVWIGNGVGKVSDPFSEANALRAAEAYLNDGLSSHHGLPRQTYGHSFPTEGWVVNPPPACTNRDEWVYTHYPEGPNVLLALMGRVVGLEKVWVLRLLPLSLCLLATAVFFWTMAQAWGADRAVLVAAACVLLPMFDTYMPGLHFQGYSWALFLLQLSLLIRIYWTWGLIPRWSGALFFLLGFIQGWLSFDQFFVVGLIAWPLWLLRRTEGFAPSKTHLALPILLTFVGFGLAHVFHFLQVAGELGGVGAALAEFRATAAARTADAGGTLPLILQRRAFAFLQSNPERSSYFHALCLAAYFYCRELLKPDRLQFFPLLPLVVLFGGLAAWFHQLELPLPRLGKPGPAAISFLWPAERGIGRTLLSALFVSLIWTIVMPAHTVGNRHITARHFFVFYFLLVLILVRGIRLRQLARPGG